MPNPGFLIGGWVMRRFSWWVAGLTVLLALLGVYLLFLQGGPGRPAVPPGVRPAEAEKKGPAQGRIPAAKIPVSRKDRPGRRKIEKKTPAKNPLPSGSLLVRVLDRKGKPLPGFPVTLFCKPSWEKSLRQDTAVARKRTGPKGETLFEKALSLLRKEKMRKYILYAGPGLPLAPSLFQPVLLQEETFRKPPPQVVLRAPDFGYLRVHAPPSLQARIPGQYLLYVLSSRPLASTEPGKRRRWTAHHFGLPPKSGTALIPVGLNLEIEVGLLIPGFSPRSVQKVHGPILPGQVVQVFLPSTELDLCRARALDEKGGILARKTIQVFLPRIRTAFLVERNLALEDFFETETDGKGYFSFPLPGDFKQHARQGKKKEESLQALFQVRPEKGKAPRTLPPRATAEIPLARPAGTCFLGDVEFHPPLYRIRVHLQDDAGKPVPGASVLLKTFSKQSPAASSLNKKSDGNGDCKFHLYSRNGEYTLFASKQGYKDAQTSPRPLETADRVLEVHRTGRIAFHVLLEKEAWDLPLFPKVQLFAYQVLPKTGCRGSGSVIERALSKSSIPRLDPGIYRVVIKVYGGKDPILAFDGIKVEGGKTTRDPRLNPLDLRPYVHSVSLEVVTPKGWEGPVYSPAAHLIPKGPHSFQFLLPKPFPAKILLQGPGLADKLLTLTRREQKVVMEKGLPLRLVLAGRLPGLPQGIRIGARELPTCSHASYRGTGFSFYESLAGHYQEWASSGALGEFDREGRCLLFTGGPGRRKIEFFLVSRKSPGGPHCRTLEERILQVPAGASSPPPLQVELDGNKIVQALKNFQEK